MTFFENYFLFSLEKFVSIPLVITFFLALKGVGMLVGRGNNLYFVSPYVGIGIIYSFTLLFSLAQPSINISFLTYIVLIIGLLIYLKKLRSHFYKDMLKMFIVCPLIFYAAFVKEFSWDDYTHWLFYVDYLFEYNHLPIKEIPFTKNAQETYPYGISIIRYLPNVFLNELNPNISALFNVLFLTSIFDFYNLLFKSDKQNKKNFSFFTKISLILPVIFLIFILHNTRVVTNAATDLILALTVTGILFYLNQFFLSSFKKNFSFFVTIIFLFIALISLKQVGIFILILILASITCVLIFYHFNINKLKEFLPLIKNLSFLFIAFTISSLMYLLWNYYSAEIGGLKNTFNPVIEKIFFDKTFDIIFGISEHFKRRPYFLIFFIFLLYIAFSYKKNFINNFFVFFIVIFSISLFSFIFLSYLTIFAGEARRAVSFDRYLLPASMAVTSLIYFILLEKYIFQFSIYTRKILSIGIFLLLNLLMILNPMKFVRANVLNEKKILNFLQSNITNQNKFVLVDEINWGFRGNLFKFKLRKILDPSKTLVFSTNENYVDMIRLKHFLKSHDGIVLFSNKITRERFKEIANYFKLIKPENNLISKLNVIIIRNK